jgi:hypothetical protein
MEVTVRNKWKFCITLEEFKQQLGEAWRYIENYVQEKPGEE